MTRRVSAVLNIEAKTPGKAAASRVQVLRNKRVAVEAEIKTLEKEIAKATASLTKLRDKQRKAEQQSAELFVKISAAGG